MAVFASDILRQRTVDVCPRNVCRLLLERVSTETNEYQGNEAAYPVDIFHTRTSRSQPPDQPLAIGPGIDDKVRKLTRHKDIIPRHHCPDTHDVACQGLLMVPVGVEYMYLGIVQRDDNVLFCKVQTCDDSLVGSDMLNDTLTTFSPCCFHQILLLEM